jgi:hypothetical protein
LTILHVQVTHGSKLLCACRVKNLKHALLAVNLNLFKARRLKRAADLKHGCKPANLLAVAIFDGRVILLNEDALNELYSLQNRKREGNIDWKDVVVTYKR